MRYYYANTIKGTQHYTNINRNTNLQMFMKQDLWQD